MKIIASLQNITAAMRKVSVIVNLAEMGNSTWLDI